MPLKIKKLISSHLPVAGCCLLAFCLLAVVVDENK